MNRRGFVYAFSLLIIFLLTIAGTSVLIRSAAELDLSERFGNLNAAFHLAEAALDHAISNLRSGNTETIASTAFPGGTYSAEIVFLGGSRYRIAAHGLSTGNQRALEAIVQLTPRSVFRSPLFGKDSVDMKKGGLTDSFDSSQGAYHPSTAGSNGSIVTNNTAASSIRLRQGTAVNGQLIVGPGLADPTSAVSVDETVIITGTPTIVSASQAMSLPAVDTTGLSCTGDLNLPKNGTFTFQQANSPYCFNKINADQGSVIEVSGNVVVYANQVDFDKHLDVNANGKPTQLLVQVYGTSDVVIDKEGTFVGALYAPGARVRLKKEVGFYGSLVGKSAEIDKESLFHFDEALKSVGPAGSYDVSVISWRDL